MNWLKLMFYGLLAGQFLFMAWILSSIKLEGKVTVQEPNEIILISEIVLAGAMSITAIYLMLRQLYKIAQK
jgi:hypothetical protein